MSGKQDCSIAVMTHFIIGLYFLISKTDLEELEFRFLPSKFRIVLVTSAPRIPVLFSRTKQLYIYIVTEALL